ncbi:Blue copper protein [Nymphaea thermarum]|nr:Blue copper protein [Nymphaea thermarum]
MARAYTTIAAIALCAFICLLIPISAKDYTVGDNSGWGQGFDYSQWTQGKTLVVGDSLVFNYDSSLHTLYEVSSADYDGCSSKKYLNTDTSSGATTIPLKTAGTHYFICGTTSHCMSGMKMSVSVSAAGSPTTPSPSTTTPSTTSTTTSTTGSFANSLQAPIIGGAIVAAAVALFA